MSKLVTVSLTDGEYKALEYIKAQRDAGASSVMRMGIRFFIDKYPERLNTLQEENQELIKQNEKLLLKVNTQARRLFDIEQEGLK